MATKNKNLNLKLGSADKKILQLKSTNEELKEAIQLLTKDSKRFEMLDL